MMVLFASCSDPKPDLKVAEEGLRNILKVEAAEFVYRDVVYQGREDKLLGIVTTGDTRLLFSVNFKVRAGIDLKKGLSMAYIEGLSKEQEPAVSVTIAPAEILSIDADESSIRELFSYEMSFLEKTYGIGEDRRIKWLDVQDEVNKAKDRLRADAVARGIETRAWKNASSLIANFLRLAGFKTVRVEAMAIEAGAPSPAAASWAEAGK